MKRARAWIVGALVKASMASSECGLLDAVERRIAEIELQIEQQLALFEELRRDGGDTGLTVLRLRELQDAQAEAQSYQSTLSQLVKHATPDNANAETSTRQDEDAAPKDRTSPDRQ